MNPKNTKPSPTQNEGVAGCLLKNFIYLFFWVALGCRSNPENNIRRKPKNDTITPNFGKLLLSHPSVIT
jgi:hypothetical protein